MPVKFYLHPKVNKKGEAPITISINIRQTRLLTTLGYSVDPAAWKKRPFRSITTISSGS